MEKENEELVSNISYDVVKEIAPEELDVFDDVKEEFFKNPSTFTEKDIKKREKMLGFAVPGIVVTFITTSVLPLAWDIIKKYVTDKVSGNELSSDKIKEIRNDAYSTAISMGIDDKKAGLMADSLTGKVVQLISK